MLSWGILLVETRGDVGKFSGWDAVGSFGETELGSMKIIWIRNDEWEIKYFFAHLSIANQTIR